MPFSCNIKYSNILGKTGIVCNAFHSQTSQKIINHPGQNWNVSCLSSLFLRLYTAPVWCAGKSNRAVLSTLLLNASTSIYPPPEEMTRWTNSPLSCCSGKDCGSFPPSWASFGNFWFIVPIQLIWRSPVMGSAFWKILPSFSFANFQCNIILHQHNKGMAAYVDKPVYRWLLPLVYRKTNIILLSWLLYDDIAAVVKREQVKICPNGIS